MKTNLKSVVFFCGFALITLLFGCSSEPAKNDTSQLKYTYSRLKIMDLDQMSEIMQSHVAEFKRTDDANVLKEALLICLSRPDEDSVVEKTISTVQTPLDDRDLWESTVQELIDQSAGVIRDRTQSSTDQVTYSVVLENLISQLRPEFIRQYKSPGFETRMIEKIAAAEIELQAPAIAERKLNMMKGSFSASQVAQRLIEKRDESLKSEKKKSRKDKNENAG